MKTFVCSHCSNSIHAKIRIRLFCLTHTNLPCRCALPPFLDTPSLDVRQLQTWAYPFQMLNKAGGADLPCKRLLTRAERLAVFFNLWALLLGPVYLAWVGLWRRALAVSAAWLLLPGAGLLLLDFALARAVAWQPALAATGQHWLAMRPLAWLALWVAGALACTVRANRDFYRQRQAQERAWGGACGFGAGRRGG